MLNLIRNSTLYHHCRFVPSQILGKHEHYCFLQNHAFSIASSKGKIAESIKTAHSENLFTVSYLMESCGLSQERAVSASKYVSFGSPEKPDSVLAFMKNQGFRADQISVVIRKYPRVLLRKPEKVFLPKLDFFESMGLSRSETISLLAKSQGMLLLSTERRIIPYFNKLDKLFNSKDELLFCIKRCPDLLSRNIYHKVLKNIQIFREAGADEGNVFGWLRRQPRSFLSSSKKVKEITEELKKMGFNPQYSIFMLAAYVKIAMKKIIWEEKIEHFKTLGVSEDVLKTAFRSYPWCMASSKEHVKKIMGFFVDEMGFEPLDVMKVPQLFSKSLERNIIPRYSVYQVLSSRGLVKKKIPMSIFKCSKETFHHKFVERYLEEAPEILKFVQTD